MRLTDFLVLLNHLPLLVEGPQPADLLLGLLGQENVDLLAVFVAQFEGVLHAHVEVIVAPIDGVPHLVAVHIDAALVVQDVPAYQILQERRNGEGGARGGGGGRGGVREMRYGVSECG